MFKTFEMAAEALLHTTCSTLQSRKVNFVIVGGWSPYLRGGLCSLAHPGTRDVDVLFTDGDRIVVEDAIRAMLSEGFCASAKHNFQLLLPLKVGGRDFVFNVDFMHPSEQIDNPELLEDIFDLGVPDSSDPTGKRWMKSIIFQSATIVFGKRLFSDVVREGLNVQGNRVTSCIPLLDEAGLILSKLNSVKIAKRPRDAFDIFYTLAGPNGAVAGERITQLAGEIEEVKEQIQSFRRWIDIKAHIFDGNVERYMSVGSNERPSAVVERMLR